MLDGFGIPDALGVVGSLLICGAYFLVSTGRMPAETIRFQLINVSGACLLLFSLWFRPNPGAILIEAIWLVIALGAILRILARR